MSPAGAGTVDDARIPFRERLIAEPKPLHDTRPEVLDDDIGAVDQPQCDFLAARILEIDGDRAFIAVEAQVRRAFPLDEQVRHAPVAHPVALDRLDLDNLGAEIAQHLGCKRPLGELGEIGDDESCERSAHGRSLQLLSVEVATANRRRRGSNRRCRTRPRR